MEPVARGEAACKQGLGVILPVFVCVLHPNGIDDALADLDGEAGSGVGLHREERLMLVIRRREGEWKETGVWQESKGGDADKLKGGA